MLERLDELLGLGGELAAPGGDQVHGLLGDADDLARLPVRSHRHQHPERVGEPLGGHPLRHRGGGGAPAEQAAPVEGAPHAVGALHAVEHPVVDVQVRVVVAGVVLEERRHDPVVRVDPAACGAAVVPDAGVARLLGEVGEPGVVARPDGVLDGLAEHRPRVGRLVVPGLAGGNLLRLERGVRERDRLLHVERDVEERDVVPRVLSSLNAQFSLAFRGGLRLAFKRGGVQLVLGLVLAAGVAERGHLVPLGRVVEPVGAGVEEPLVDRTHVLRVDQPGEAERLGSGAPPPARRLPRGDRAGVIVLPAGRDLPQQVVGAVAAGDPQHHDDPTMIL